MCITYYRSVSGLCLIERYNGRPFATEIPARQELDSSTGWSGTTAQKMIPISIMRNNTPSISDSTWSESLKYLGSSIGKAKRTIPGQGSNRRHPVQSIFFAIPMKRWAAGLEVGELRCCVNAILSIPALADSSLSILYWYMAIRHSRIISIMRPDYAGTSIVTSVPLPTSEVIEKLPPSECARSYIPTSPNLPI